MSKIVNRNSFESVSQSDSWNLIEQKSCDFTAVFKYHKSLWLSNMWQNNACFVNQENFRAACRVNKNIHDKQNLNFSVIRY